MNRWINGILPFPPYVGVVMGIVLLSLLVGAIVYWTMLRPSCRARRLLKTGKPAPATILATWNTGVTCKDEPQLGLRLEVRPDDRPPFRVETRLYVPLLRVALFQPGAVLQVRYNPRDTTNVVVVGLRRRQAVGTPEGALRFDGRIYASVDDMPPQVRQAYEKVRAVLGETDWPGYD